MSQSLNDLPAPWVAAFNESIVSYVERESIPVGAIVTNADGQIVAAGGNAYVQARLAHAEMSALNAIPSSVDRKQCTIYTTVEPCPMCVGAIRMAQLKGLQFAARDPAAGSANFLTANTFMREFVHEVWRPSAPELEFVVVALVTEHRARTSHNRWREAWNKYAPAAVSVGKKLAEDNKFADWRSSRASAATIYECVLKFRQQNH